MNTCTPVLQILLAANGETAFSLSIVLATIILLILLVAVFKINAFISFVISSMAMGLALGLDIPETVQAVKTGLGNLLGDLVLIIVLGAMLGKLVAESGAAQRIATNLIRVFGKKHIMWALLITCFIVGIPLFYSVGFVLMVPLIFAISKMYKLPAVYIGLPAMAGMSVAHGYLPPTPAPVALAGQFNADIGLVLMYGIVVAIPAVLLGGPAISPYLKRFKAEPLQTFVAEQIPEDQLPGMAKSVLSALLPVILISLSQLVKAAWFDFPAGEQELSAYRGQLSGPDRLVYLLFIQIMGNVELVMILSLAAAVWMIGLSRGPGVRLIDVMKTLAGGAKDISLILLIIGGSGCFKEILIVSGIDTMIGDALSTVKLNPLILGWMITVVIRIALGSATVAGLTSASILVPLVGKTGVNPELMVLSIGAGSLACSHVNDGGFWMFKEYFNLTVKETFCTWTLMESIVSVVGLAGVLLFDFFLL